MIEGDVIKNLQYVFSKLNQTEKNLLAYKLFGIYGIEYLQYIQGYLCPKL